MLDFSQQKDSSQEYESILPLVNIVFLLLIFFMLAGAFTTPDLFKVDPPTSTSKEDSNSHENIVLISKLGVTAYLDETMSLDNLASLVKASKDNNHFIVKADANTSSIAVIDVINTLQNAGVEKVEILTVKN